MGTILAPTSKTLGEDYVKLAQSFVNVYQRTQLIFHMEIRLQWSRCQPGTNSWLLAVRQGMVLPCSQRIIPLFGHIRWWGGLDSMLLLSMAMWFLQRFGSFWYLCDGWIVLYSPGCWVIHWTPVMLTPPTPSCVSRHSHIPQGVWLLSAGIHSLGWNRTVIYDAPDKVRGCLNSKAELSLPGRFCSS